MAEVPRRPQDSSAPPNMGRTASAVLAAELEVVWAADMVVGKRGDAVATQAGNTAWEERAVETGVPEERGRVVVKTAVVRGEAARVAVLEMVALKATARVRSRLHRARSLGTY